MKTLQNRLIPLSQSVTKIRSARKLLKIFSMMIEMLCHVETKAANQLDEFSNIEALLILPDCFPSFSAPLYEYSRIR